MLSITDWGLGGTCGVGETDKRSRIYFFFGGGVMIKNVLKWTVMVVAQLCEYTKKSFQWGNCMVCKFHLSKNV